MVELETRELAYFLAVAEELHFGRAAERLSIAQPALSKSIKRLEQRLGVELLVRSSRRVSLTASGEALLRDGRHALNAVAVAAQSARRAVEANPHLRLVIKPGGDANLLSGILAAYARRPDSGRVDILFGGNTDRADYLRDGRADVALLYVPFDDTGGLAYETLYVEDRVAILPAAHPLAAREELRLADLRGETMPRWKDVSYADIEAGVLPEASGPAVADLAQMNQLIALGRMVALLPRSLAEPLPADLVRVPVDDAPVNRLVLAWPERDPSPLVAPFVEAALEAVDVPRPAEGPHPPPGGVSGSTA
jgi:DNA-binding transcriptional LysR family regulator